MSGRADFDPVDPIDDADPEDFNRPELHMMRVVDQDGAAVTTEEDMLWEEVRLLMESGLDSDIAAGNKLLRLYPMTQQRAPASWNKECKARTGYSHQHCNRLMRLAEKANDERVTRSELASYWEQLLGNQDVHPILKTLTSKSAEWYTPERYIKAARDLLETIDLDPASNAAANKTVKAKRYYDRDTNGFDKPWKGKVWLNPPYGRGEAGSNQDAWSLRLIQQYEAGVTKEAVLLVNAAVDTEWFQRLFQFPVCFPDHRINFDTPEGSTSGSTHGSALVYLGPQRDRFVQIFSRFGIVVESVAWDDGDTAQVG